MPENEIFLAFEKDGFLFWKSTTGETREIGATSKTFQAVNDALEAALREREQYFDMLVAAGLIERPKDPQEIAREALEEARAAREETAKMAQAMMAQTQLLEKLLKNAEVPPQPRPKPELKSEQKQEKETKK